MKARMFFCFLAVVLVGVVALPAFGQNQFVKALGGTNKDWGYSVVEVSDGGLVVTGYTASYGAGYYDLLLAKFDGSGNHLWTRTLGGTSYDYGYSVVEVSDGRLVVTGWTESYGAGSDDLLLAKFDGSGNHLWTKTLGGTDYDYGSSVVEVSDGGLVVTGGTYSYGAGYYDLLLTKFDGSGNHLWTRMLGGTGGDYGYSVVEVSDGGVVVAGYTSSYGAGYEDLLLAKFDGSGNHLWTRTLGGTGLDYGCSVVEVSDGGLVVTGLTKSYGAGSWDLLLAKFDGSGNHLWTRTLGGTGYDCGYSVVEVSDGGLVIAGNTKSYGAGYEDLLLAKFDADGNTCMGEFVTPEVHSVSPTITTPSPTVNTWSPTITSPDPTITPPDPTLTTVCVSENPIKLVLKDGSDLHNPIPNKEFKIFKVQNDPPQMPETFMGNLTTDDEGKITLPGGWFNEGDWVKVERVIHTEPARKHPDLLPTMYSMKIDNAKFNTTTGAISYHALTGDAEQELILDHTTVMYNLLMSIEWSADVDYLVNLEDGLRLMSNYLYDVGDGQMYIDTVMIYDNKDKWPVADVRIHANNMQWPKAWVFGAFRQEAGRCILFPRIFYFNSYDGNRNLTYSLYPYDWTRDTTSFRGIDRAYPPIRTLAHEFGHYGTGFLDEYCMCPCGAGDGVFPGNGTDTYDFGLMDDPVKIGVEKNSEMSCGIQYADHSHRVTCQWTDRGNRSCWDWFEEDGEEGAGMEGDENDDGIFAQIFKPTERGSGDDMFWGPNDNLTDLNYDVGSKLAYTLNHENTGARTVTVKVYRYLIFPKPKAKVTLIKTGRDDIQEGETANNGKIRCLGYNDGDEVRVEGRHKIIEKGIEEWLCGSGVLGSSGKSRFNNRFRTSMDGDTLEIFLRTVQGSYPLIHSFALGSTDSYYLTIEKAFSSNPTLELHPEGGGDYAYSFDPDGNGYSVTVTDEMGESGRFTVLAIDDSSYTFFVNNNYEIVEFSDTSFISKISGPEDACRVDLDTLNIGLQKVMILGSNYPPLRNGLEPESEQGGEVYSICSYPPEMVLLGENSITIRYADSDLQEQSEMCLRIFKWNEPDTSWHQIGGEVDTSWNEVGVTIQEFGIYAAFTTTDTGVGIGSGSLPLELPGEFSLAQNYPNPFNAITEMKYALARDCWVRLEIYNILGQRVATLVDAQQKAGYKTARWDAGSFSSGIYFYRLKAGDFVKTRKMVLLR